MQKVFFLLALLVMMSRARADLPRILMTVRLVPVRDAKTGQSGFRVKGVDPGSLFAREGVKPGDLLLTRNSSKK